MCHRDRPRRPFTFTPAFALALVVGAGACAPADDSAPEAAADAMTSSFADRVAQYSSVRLTADLSTLSDADRSVVRHLIQAVEPMDSVFWKQSWGDRAAILEQAGDDDALRTYIEINYGPWDRLAGDAPFIDGIGPKPAGARFYPEDMTDAEFEAASETRAAVRSLYTMVVRGYDGYLVARPYH